MNFFEEKDGSLYFRENGETVMITPWGTDSLRVRARILSDIGEESAALLTPPPTVSSIQTDEWEASIENGNIKAVMTVQPWGHALQITFYDKAGKVLLKEIPNGGALQKKARLFKPLPGGAYSLKASFVPEPGEKIYGMGQHQQEIMNYSGQEHTLEVNPMFYIVSESYPADS